MARKPSAPPAATHVAPPGITPKDPPLVFTNTTANSTIHLGDGRKLAPGESVEVTAELLRELRA